MDTGLFAREHRRQKMEFGLSAREYIYGSTIKEVSAKELLHKKIPKER
jgi:hypothetical protein